MRLVETRCWLSPLFVRAAGPLFRRFRVTSGKEIRNEFRRDFSNQPFLPDRLRRLAETRALVTSPRAAKLAAQGLNLRDKFLLAKAWSLFFHTYIISRRADAARSVPTSYTIIFILLLSSVAFVSDNDLERRNGARPEAFCGSN